MSPLRALEADQLRRLLAAGGEVVAALDPETVLDRLLEAAQDLTCARYAALGVLDEDRRWLDRFLTRGVDAETHAAIGDLPHGRGILGLLIEDPRPIRLSDVSAHPSSYGFPSGHPEMATFLGVPVSVRGEAFGNLYLTDKEGGEEFTPADQEIVEMLAGWAGIAIENARLYERAERRRQELERAVRGLEATTAIARAVGAETELRRVLELIVKRARALVGSEGAAILLRDAEDRLVLAATAGHTQGADGHTALPAAGTPLILARPLHVTAGDGILDPIGLGERDGLLVPLVFRGRTLGALGVLGMPAGSRDEDQGLLSAFAASAATAVATARSVEEQRLRDSLDAAEAERRRWARELHDETLQALGGLRIALRGALRREDPERLRDDVARLSESVDEQIASLRRLIADLRPATLDELGVRAALEGLANRVAAEHDLDVRLDVELPGSRLAPQLETVIYRLVQESLTNAVKHSGAGTVHVAVRESGAHIAICVADDGTGFEPAGSHSGFGLVGMRERVEMLGGEVSITSSPDGTRVEAGIPLARA